MDMIPMLILYVAKKFGLKITLSSRLEAIKRAGLKVIVLILLTVVTKASARTSSSFSNVHENTVVFKVLKNNKTIGTIEIVKQESNNTITYNLNSEIRAKLIFKFKVVGKETYVFRNGVLEYSSLYRTLNDKVKVNQSLVYENGSYHLKKPDQEIALDLEAIQKNLITLYFQEPKNTKTVYCDNQGEMLGIQHVHQGVYKVIFSNGKYNTFYYENGRCVKIEAVSPLFKVTLIPS